MFLLGSILGYSQAPTANFSLSPNPICSGQVLQITDLSTGAPTAWSYTVRAQGPGGGMILTAQNPTAVVNGQGTMSVTLIASNASGASAPVTLTLQVLTSPNAGITPNNQQSCVGGSVNSLSITAGGGPGGGSVAGLTFSWSTGNTNSIQTVSSINSTTVFSCIITGTNGCTATRFATVSIGIPTVSILSNPVNICPGTTSTQTATGSGGGPYTFIWSDAAITRTTTASQAGVLSVSVTNALGCTGTHSVNLVTSTTLAMNAFANNTIICQGNTTLLNANGATSYSWSTGSTNASSNVGPTVTTTYFVYGTAGTCTGSAAITISVNVTPTIAVSANPSSLCSGKSATLTANGAGSYTWVPSGTAQSSLVVNPLGNVTYSVRGSNAGCPVRTATISLNVLPAPNMLVVNSNSSICAGDEIALAASGANSYTWSTGTTAAIVLVTPTANTTYTVMGTGTNGCETTVAFTQTVNECTNLQKLIDAEDLMSVYPNPANDALLIKAADFKNFEIRTLQGQLFLSGKAENVELNEIDVSSLSDGLYILNIYKGSGARRTTRLSIKH